MSIPKIQVLGDAVQDILLSDSGARPIVWEKGNHLSVISATPERELIAKAGGVRYTLEFLHALRSTDDQLKSLEIIQDAHEVAIPTLDGTKAEDVTEAETHNLAQLPTGAGSYNVSYKSIGLHNPPEMIWELSKRREDLEGSDKKLAWRATKRLANTPIRAGQLYQEAQGEIAEKFLPQNSPENVTLNIFADYNRHFRRHPGWEENGHLAQIASAADGVKDIKNIIMIANDLPADFVDEVPGDAEPMWKTLCRDEIRQHSIVILSINTLRRAGAVISRRRSWDRTVDDFVEATKQHGFLRELLKFKHLVVRIGMTAAIHCHRKGKETAITFLYDPRAKGVIFREPIEQGSIFATRAAYSACIAAKLAAASKSTDPVQAIQEGIRLAIVSSQELFPKGFGQTWDQVRDFPYQREKDEGGNAVAKRLYDKAIASAMKRLTDSPIQAIPVPNHRDVGSWNLLLPTWRCEAVDNAGSKVKGAKIAAALAQTLGGYAENDQSLIKDVNRQIHALERMRRLRCAIQICKFGQDKVLNAVKQKKGNEKLTNLLKLEWKLSRAKPFPDKLPDGNNEPQRILRWIDSKDVEVTVKEVKNYLESHPFNGPFVNYGKLVAIGQRDIENFQNVRNLLRQHLDQTKDKGRKGKPLSMAVFGSPGNGKSFAITEIANVLGSDFEARTFNLSEFSDRADLQQAFVNIAGISARGKIPLIFFDEFDAPLGERPFGWLKYFLAPMQDGTFRHSDGIIEIGPAVLVFAGGICESFAEFRAKAESLPAVNKGHADPKAGKMPDFVSRLKGHLDIPGYNRIRRAHLFKERSWQGADDHYVPYVRRALLIHSHLRMTQRVVNERLGGDRVVEAARIDEDLLRALLTVSEYRHGARSIEALLSMTMPLGGRIEKAGIPLVSQVNMHAPGAEFCLRVQYPHAIWPVETLAVLPRHGHFTIDRDAKSWADDFKFSKPELFIPVTMVMLAGELERWMKGMQEDEPGHASQWLEDWLDSRMAQPLRKQGQDELKTNARDAVAGIFNALRSRVVAALREEEIAAGSEVSGKDELKHPKWWQFPSGVGKQKHTWYQTMFVHETRTTAALVAVDLPDKEDAEFIRIEYDPYVDQRRAIHDARRALRELITTAVQCEQRNSIS